MKLAAHPECGYDRLVLDLNGPVPSYDVRYVAQVIADPSGMPITLAGRSYLLITLRPAQAHTEAGATTIVRPSKTVDYPVLKSYAVAGRHRVRHRRLVRHVERQRTQAVGSQVGQGVHLPGGGVHGEPGGVQAKRSRPADP